LLIARVDHENKRDGRYSRDDNQSNRLCLILLKHLRISVVTTSVLPSNSYLGTAIFTDVTPATL